MRGGKGRNSCKNYWNCELQDLMIRQKELLSHLCRVGRMLCDNSWGSVSNLEDEEHIVGCP